MELERLESLFHEALARTAGPSRQRWLEAQCSSPEELREVLGLLESHEAIARHRAIPCPPASPEAIPVPAAQFGAYRAVELIGRGGMSAVYRARRADGQFEQTVALKIMAGYLAAPEFLRRFETERRLLASLNHNHITRLLDGGVSSSGDPYLITEYVEGEAIDRYCDGRRLDIEGRLRLFLQVCEAVDYAHRHLIIHRDLKPANILVDHEGVAKLLDFGTASMAARPDVTLTRDRMLTPRYASPEQLRGQAVGLATDIFSLGVLLYELITGAWPFGDPDSVKSELSRVVGDAQVTSPTAAVTGDAAGRRSASADQLRRALRGDLSAIVLKALEDDPERRYVSVREFGADVARYLERKPVLARPHTAWYRAGKFARRRPAAVLAVLLLLLSCGAGVELLRQYGARRAERARQVAQLEQIVTQTSGLIASHVSSNKLEAARVEWRNLRDSLEQILRDNPESPAVYDMVANCYMNLGQLAWFRYGPSLMDAAAATESYSRAAALMERARQLHSKSGMTFQQRVLPRMFGSEVLVENGNALESYAQVAQLLREGEAERRGGQAREIEADLASFYDMLSDRLGATAAWAPIANAPAWYGPLVAMRPYLATDSIAMNVYQASLADGGYQYTGNTNTKALVGLQLGRLQHQAGLHEQGNATLRGAVEGFEKYTAANGATEFVLDRTASAHAQLGRAALAAGDLREALQQRRAALGILESQFAKQELTIYAKEKLGRARLALAAVLSRMGRRAEALQSGRTGLGLLREGADRSGAAAITLDAAAQQFLTVEPEGLRDPAKALEYARRAVRQTSSNMPPYLVTLAMAQLAAGQAAEARESAIRATERYRSVAGILKPIFDAGQYPEAERRYREWLEQLEQPALK